MWPRRILVLVALAGVMAGVIGTVGLRQLTRSPAAHVAPTTTVTVTAPPPTTTGATATVDLLGSTNGTDARINMTHDNRCFGRGQYAYLDATAPVTITYPGRGTVLATTRLSQGTLIDGACEFTFPVPKLPSLSWYLVRIADEPATVVSQVRMQSGLILRTGACCAGPVASAAA